MTNAAAPHIALETEAGRPPSTTPIIIRRLFGTPLNLIITLAFLGVFALIMPGLIRWAVLDAAVLPAIPETCSKSRNGACWSFVIAKSGQILFGIYPFDERWRPALACVLLLALLGWSVWPTNWTRTLGWLWVAALSAVFWLMRGGLGLTYVPTASWGGLPVTLILTVVAIGVAFPSAIFLALGRRSKLPTVRLLSLLFIEAIRGLPLLSILLVASIMLPLFVPDALLPDKFVRALFALTVFAAAYLAEVIRGGLQAIQAGQIDAAKALGLSFWQMQRLIVLPQAIRSVIPALANTVIVMIKNTSLVLVVGLFDLISSAKAALADPAWPAPSAETYLFVGAIYFVLAFSFARFSDFLERRMSAGERK